MTIIPAGFGRRLREERERLGFTQAQFAEAAGVQRLAQGQYESESRSPTVRFLSAIGNSGIDLNYVLFGRKSPPAAEEQRSLEKRVFELVEKYAQGQPDGRLGAEARYAMFEFLRAYLSTADANASETLDPAELIAKHLRS
ncbi:helix-turn-helix domain-containing protein [Propionivibrio dicarboxylicus]|uniref:Helix-turn-helix domain-containing protein n=1 Tax=Propionivibrio dicarboxylicus TaxID=83767 RepID=A0A1G7VAA1_9RHOO|nr:helix-turn-helix domain-containing protein [Propionivibrio dicarboxylicus]SDG56269.1 Helix-turn-helix domain-containing protein [Propionivibrio dicarboxylicus]